METKSFEKILARRSRMLIHALIISGTLNFALIATFATFVLKERRGIVLPTISQEPIKKTYLKNQVVLAEFATMSYDQLVRELYDETHVEEGQRRCDLALAVLAHFHHFDVERALAGAPIEKREALFQGAPLVLYPGLNSDRLEGIRRFARVEVWPLTAEGLLKEISRREEVPRSLQEALSCTTDYFLVQRALKRLPYALSDDALFDLITKGSLDATAVSDLPAFLLPRIEKGSQLAAYLLILVEKEFALKQLTDSQMEKLLSLLTEKTPEVEAFLSEVTSGLRSDEVQALAGKPLEVPPRHYTIQQGDNLWKISREFKVKVETIRELNQLEGDTLKPGAELLLPLD